MTTKEPKFRYNLALYVRLQKHDRKIMWSNRGVQFLLHCKFKFKQMNIDNLTSISAN